ncbi:MAG: transposase [Deltaproteobacteria bacterium]|nr:MAG: transposase [Deltaproteobacteria bacterium]
MLTRRRYTKEFKTEAKGLVLKQKIPVAQVASDLGIGKSTLDKWVRDERLRLADPNALSETELEELSRLRKENRILKMERDLLKKTAVYFAKDTQTGTNS